MKNLSNFLYNELSFEREDEVVPVWVIKNKIKRIHKII